MKIYQQLNFVVIKRQAESLYSLIADGQYHPTSLGRNNWKTLLGSQASLQTRCNQEGFNADDDQGIASKARIGIISNNEWTALHAIQGLNLVQEAHLMTQTPVETRKIGTQIIEKDTLKSWDTS